MRTLATIISMPCRFAMATCIPGELFYNINTTSLACYSSYCISSMFVCVFCLDVARPTENESFTELRATVARVLDLCLRYESDSQALQSCLG